MATVVEFLFDRGISYRADLDFYSLQEGLTKDETVIKDYLGIGDQATVIIEQLELNVSQINTNTSDINTNAEGIAKNKDDLEAHSDSTSEHGVTGNNVGNEDFCTEAVGGVVLLMEAVVDASNSTQEITLPDIAAAGASYDMAHTQTMVDMLNDSKAKHNQLVTDLNSVVTQFNDMITKAKTAKQMVL